LRGAHDVAREMMKTYSHIRRQALNQAADALEPNTPASPAPPPTKAAAATVPTRAKRVMSHGTSQNAALAEQRQRGACRQLLSIQLDIPSQYELDGFLKHHGVPLEYTFGDFEREGPTSARLWQKRQDELAAERDH
jgi:hypothetical protein